MNPSTQVMAVVQTVKKTGRWLVLITVLTLLLLLAGGVGLSHSASSPSGVQMAASNGDIYIGH